MLDRHDDAVRRLAEACRLRDAAALRSMLGDDVVAVCDSGGLVPAAIGSIHGAQDVARLVAVLLGGQPGAELSTESVNGRAGLVLRHAGRATAVIGVRVTGAGVADLWIVLNPAKLHGWHRR